MNKITSRLAFAATLGVVAFASQARAQVSYSIAKDTWTPPSLTNQATYYNTTTVPESWDAFVGVGTGTSVPSSTITSANFFPGIVPTTFTAPFIAGYESNGGSGGDTFGEPLDIGSFQFWNGTTTGGLPSSISFDVETTLNVGAYSANVDAGTFTFSLTSGANNSVDVQLTSISSSLFGTLSYGASVGALLGYGAAVPVTFSDGPLTQVYNVGFNGPVSQNFFASLGLFGPALVVGQNSGLTGVGDFDLNVSPYTPAPEPSTYALWGAAVLLGLVGYRRMSAAKASVSMV